MKSLSFNSLFTCLTIVLLLIACSDDDDSCTVGTSCDDGDALTENDIYDASCACAGTLICIEGKSCDDGDAGSYNDVYDANCDCAGVTKGSFTDSRDGQTYATIQIGTQTWFAENLNYATGNSWCYDENSANCNTYGRLYDWNAGNNACPAGWHVPTDAEWTQLGAFLGGEGGAGGKMKEAGLALWDSPNAFATNSSGFTGLPSGHRELDASFNNLGASGSFLSSTEVDLSDAWFRFLNRTSGILNRSSANKGGGGAVRCVQD